MPLALGKDVLEKARREGYAVPSFNTNNLEINPSCHLSVALGMQK
jgi:fructose/tagatose bisphosphate aldolase